MNIQEAIKSGKPFRRAKTLRDQPSIWLCEKNGLIGIFDGVQFQSVPVTIADLCAEDWEIKENPFPGEEFYLAPCDENKAYVLPLNNQTTHAYKGVVRVKIMEDSKWIQAKIVPVTDE